MKLIDRVAQCSAPFVVQDLSSSRLSRLSGACDHAAEIPQCATRFILSDDLTRLCTALAFSKGARTFSCADLLRIPAERVWVEWCEAPWQAELSRYGLGAAGGPVPVSGRRGALIRASRDGRCGWLRTFWDAGEGAPEAAASSMEAYFDFDTPPGESPQPPDGEERTAYLVQDPRAPSADILRHFLFRYERTWDEYYAAAPLEAPQRAAIARHALGTIAIAVPVLLSFFVLLSTRSGLPRRELTLDRLNRSRVRAGKRPLLEHTEVLSPLLAEGYASRSEEGRGTRHSPRYHHVRGHLVRRGDQIFWRVPHARGSALRGLVRSRTVTWTVGASER